MWDIEDSVFILPLCLNSVSWVFFSPHFAFKRFALNDLSSITSTSLNVTLSQGIICYQLNCSFLVDWKNVDGQTLLIELELWQLFDV